MIWHFIAIVILALAIPGCSQNKVEGTPREISPDSGITTAQPGLVEVKMTIGHTSYEPNVIEAKAGDKIIIKAVAAKGTSTHNHGITIDEYNINKAVTTEDKENPSIIEFMADKAGEFRIYCKTCWDGPFGRNHPDIEAKLIVR